jgi:hypothetical protein
VATGERPARSDDPVEQPAGTGHGKSAARSRASGSTASRAREPR